MSGGTPYHELRWNVVFATLPKLRQNHRANRRCAGVVSHKFFDDHSRDIVYNTAYVTDVNPYGYGRAFVT